MKKIIITILSLIAIVSVIVFFVHKNKQSKAANTWYEARVIMEDMAEYVEATGVVAPRNRIDVTPTTSGRIEKYMVEEGAHVKAGQVLAEMSSSDRVSILDAARSMSAEQYAYYLDAYKSIKITAPASGTIILKDVVNGQTVASSNVIYAISDTLIVEANIDESDVGKVQVGQTALINLDAYPETTVEGIVTRIADEGKSTSNVIQYKVKIRLNKIPSFFKSQMTANIKIRLSKVREFLLIPAASVIINPESGKTAVVTSLDSSGKPVYTDIETGATTERGIEIVSGLKEGDKVMYKQGKYVPPSTVAQDEGSNPLMPKRPSSRPSTKKGTITATR